MKVDGQLGMDETVLEEPELEQLLEKRQKAKEGAKATSKRFREADASARGQIATKVPMGTIARVGRFRIERKPTEPRHVEFDAEAGERLNISADGTE